MVVGLIVTECFIDIHKIDASFSLAVLSDIHLVQQKITRVPV